MFKIEDRTSGGEAHGDRAGVPDREVLLARGGDPARVVTMAFRSIFYEGFRVEADWAPRAAYGCLEDFASASPRVRRWAGSGVWEGLLWWPLPTGASPPGLEEAVAHLERVRTHPEGPDAPVPSDPQGLEALRRLVEAVGTRVVRGWRVHAQSSRVDEDTTAYTEVFLYETEGAFAALTSYTQTLH